MACTQQPVARQIDLNDDPALQELVSEQFSDWSNVVVVDQALIDAFAQLSGDDYWIHTDPERARLHSPFGGTIAHGALVQVLQSRMKLELGFEITGFSTQINYGSDRLRFPAPVPAGSRSPPSLPWCNKNRYRALIQPPVRACRSWASCMSKLTPQAA
mgnify:CR=1 FL=1